MVNVALNKRLNAKGVYCYTCCPGLVMTGVAYGIMPQWIWMLVVVPLLMLVCSHWS
jgi:predicted metal-binding membrane protein